MVIFTETENPISIDKIEQIEKLVGFKFPELYKNHLLKYNGGRCYPNVFQYYENNKRLNASDIDWFFAIYDGEYDNLEKEIKIMKIEEKRIPYRMIPIAHDSGGNLICISCFGYDLGKIYFWDHENEVDYEILDEMNCPNIYFIANNFTDFLNGLKKIEDI